METDLDTSELASIRNHHNTLRDVQRLKRAIGLILVSSWKLAMTSRLTIATPTLRPLVDQQCYRQDSGFSYIYVTSFLNSLCWDKSKPEGPIDVRSCMVPSQGLGLHLDPPVHQVVIKWWLGLDTSQGSQYALCPDNALDRSDRKQSDGVSIVPWKCGQLLVQDATCPDTFVPSYSTLLHSMLVQLLNR
ncbi:hypothetical protein EMCRGX_G015765 [Ephydatia muelleri]